MKTLDVEQLRANLDKYLAQAQSEDIVVTIGGEPRVVLAAVEDDDVANSPEFWEMIQKRRAENKTIPWEEAKRRLNAKP